MVFEHSEETKKMLLDEDSAFATSKTYAVISFCTSDTRQKLSENGKMALKVRGCFETVDLAIDHIKKLSAHDNSFDMYICEMYKWTLLPPGGSSQEESESVMVDILKAHKDRICSEKRRFDERKERIKENGLNEDDAKEIEDMQAEGADPKGKQPVTDLKDIKPLEGKDAAGNFMTNEPSIFDTDPVKETDVNYIVLSYVHDQERHPGSFVVKIRGATETRDKAEKLVELLSQMDQNHDIFIADAYKWLQMPVDDTKIETKYREEHLQSLFEGYEKAQNEAKAHMSALEKTLLENVHPVEASGSSS